LVTSQANDTNELAQGAWLVRTRAILVDPIASSSSIKPTLGGHADDISTEATVEFDVNYFFTKNISTELILATTKHNVEARNTVLGDVNLGTVNLLPPTLTALYHFFPESRVSPYIGAGINYTYFYSVNPGSVATSVDYKNSIGPALQAGFDVALNNHWSLNADVKKLYINSDVTVETGGALPTQKTSVDINPFVFGVGFGYRFS
jgi:outer membrane protein